MSQLRQITVNLAERSSPPRPKEVFRWASPGGQLVSLSQGAAIGASSVDLVAISTEIFRHPRTLSILTEAFTRGLSRDIAWDLEGIPGDEIGSYLAAARVFKRGVPTVNAPLTQGEPRRQTTSGKSYNVTVFEEVGDCFENATSKDCVIIDAQVAKFWSGKTGLNFQTIEFSEARKNIQTLAKIVSLLGAQIERQKSKDFSVYVVGGGVAGDVVGFACGLLDLNFQYVPTTLLAMVDSSVGGKVGVNFEPWGKNQIGLFHQPASVRICPDWLTTLPDVELRNGLAESFKHALLCGDFDLWCEIRSACESRTKKIESDLVMKVIQVKCAIVARDPEEHGERAVLNFGHTFGHAVETIAINEGFVMPHGECVAIGMIHALRLSKKYLAMHLDPFLEDLSRSGVIGTPASKKLFGATSDFLKHRDEILKLMVADKKSKADGKIRFVLLERPGVVARDVDGGWTRPFDAHRTWQDVTETVALISKMFL